MSENNNTEEKKTSENKISRKKLPIAVICIGIILLFVIYIGYASSYDKVYPNTYIDGEKVSGLTYAQVKEKLQSNIKNATVPENIEFTLRGESFSVSSDHIKLEADAEKTAKAAVDASKDKNIFKRVINYTKSFFNKKELDFAYSYNDKKLNKAISKFSSPYEIQPVDATYEVDGNKLIITKGQPGKVIDQNALKRDLPKFIKNPNAPINLALKKTKEKEFDLNSFYKEITSDAKDAYYSRDDEGNVVVIPDKPKVIVEKNEIKKALDSENKVVSLNVQATPAKITEKALSDALFSGVMGDWTSYFSAGNRPRSANVALAAQRIDGIVLLPGESFSYDKTVGPRTAKNGFKVAGVYINNKVEQGIGGGVCQTSSTLYSAVLYANLEIVSRTSHSLPVSYMPPGQDATIAEGAIDFVFKNNTDYPVKISATINGGSVTCKIIGTPVQGQKVVINNSTTAIYEPKTEIETDPTIPKGYKKTVIGSKGSAVSSSRTVYKNGKTVSTQRLTNSVYNSTPTVVTVNPEDKNTPPESLTEYSEEEAVTPPETLEQEGETPSTQAPPSEPEEEEIFEI